MLNTTFEIIIILCHFAVINEMRWVFPTYAHTYKTVSYSCKANVDTIIVTSY